MKEAHTLANETAQQKLSEAAANIARLETEQTTLTAQYQELQAAKAELDGG